jgi:HlyD family secretion protein
VLDSSDAQADLAAANARIDEARSTIESLEAGGRKRDIVDIDQSVRQRNTELRQAEQDLAIAERLAAKNAGTREDVRALKDRVELLRVQIAALEARRPVLVSSADLASAKARLREATSAAALATRRIQLSTIRSPIDGVVYQLDVRQGAYLSPGALVANIGKLDALKILVYVDEPDLGRIRTGMPVKITWDAMEGKSWDGTIDKIPTQIVPLGTRQVGEVECRISNTSGDLIPGTNVNAFIETRKLEGVLLLPKEGIRERDGSSGVYLIENRKLVWRKVELGSSNVTRTIVKSGLKAGDVVALGPESNLKEGATVDPSLPQS